MKTRDANCRFFWLGDPERMSVSSSYAEAQSKFRLLAIVGDSEHESIVFRRFDVKFKGKHIVKITVIILNNIAKFVSPHVH